MESCRSPMGSPDLALLKGLTSLLQAPHIGNYSEALLIFLELTIPGTTLGSWIYFMSSSYLEILWGLADLSWAPYTWSYSGVLLSLWQQGLSKWMPPTQKGHCFTFHEMHDLTLCGQGLRQVDWWISWGNGQDHIHQTALLIKPESNHLMEWNLYVDSMNKGIITPSVPLVWR